jgi:hypothetical protein
MDDFATFECRLVRENARASDVRTLHGIRIGIIPSLQHLYQSVNKMRVGAAMARALGN